jgi:hypothetical protein
MARRDGFRQQRAGVSCLPCTQRRMLWSRHDYFSIEREDAMSHLSAHADYRHEDYFFARTQSRTFAGLTWEKSPPLHSWSEYLHPAMGAVAALAAIAEIIH